MENSMESIERGITIIDTLIKNDIMIWFSDGTLKYKAQKGIDPSRLDVLLKMLKSGKSDVLPIVSDIESVRRTLSDRQRSLSTAFNGVVVLEEHLDRLSEMLARRGQCQ